MYDFLPVRTINLNYRCPECALMKACLVFDPSNLITWMQIYFEIRKHNFWFFWKSYLNFIQTQSCFNENKT